MADNNEDIKINIKAQESSPSVKDILNKQKEAAKEAAQQAKAAAKEAAQQAKEAAKSAAQQVKAQKAADDERAKSAAKAAAQQAKVDDALSKTRLKNIFANLRAQKAADDEFTKSFAKSCAAREREAARSHKRELDEKVKNIVFAARRERQEAARREKESAGTYNIGAVGHFAGAMGLYNTGHIMRGMSMMGIGNNLTSGDIAAIGGVLLAVKALQLGAEAVTYAFKQTAGALVSATGTIGRSRNLEGMLVEGASAERLASHIAMNVSDPTTTGQVLRLMNKTSANSEFTPEEVGQGFSAFKSKTGKFGPLNQLAGFMADLSSMSGMSMSETGGIMGQVTTEFPQLEGDRLKQVMRNLFQLGIHGAVELRDAQSITQALGFAGKSGLGLEKGLNLEMGLVQLAQRFTGGQSAQQAVTGVRRLQEELLLSHGAKKEGALQSLLGKDYLTHDSTGQLIFADETKSLAKLALASYEGKVPTTMIEERGQKALMGITGSLSKEFTPGMKESEKLDIIEKAFRALENGTMTIDDFNGKLVEVKDTVEYQLRKSFNELSIQLETALLPVLRDQVVPLIKHFAAALEDPEVQKGLQDLFSRIVAGGEELITILPWLAEVFLGLANNMAGVLGLETPEEKVSRAKKILAAGGEFGADESGATQFFPLSDEEREAFQATIRNLEPIVNAMANAIRPVSVPVGKPFQFGEEPSGFFKDPPGNNVSNMLIVDVELNRQILEEQQKHTIILQKIADKGPNKPSPTPGSPGVAPRSNNGEN